MKRHSLANSRWSPASASNALALGALVVSLLALSACPGSLGTDYALMGATGGGTGTGRGGSGGSSGGADAGPIVTSCANAVALLMTNCSSCHSNPPLFANLDLISANVAQRLVGQPGSSTGGGMCSAASNGSLLNRNVLPATGILIDKINGNQACGGSMPYGVDMLAPTDIACLEAWANGLVSGVGP